MREIDLLRDCVVEVADGEAELRHLAGSTLQTDPLKVKLYRRLRIVHEPSGIAGSAPHAIWPRAPRKAIARLRRVLAVEWRGAATLSLGAPWDDFRVGPRILVSWKHRDYPALLANALDALAENGWAYEPTARYLKVLRKDVIIIVCKHGPAHRLWNLERARRGLRPILFPSHSYYR